MPHPQCKNQIGDVRKWDAWCPYRWLPRSASMRKKLNHKNIIFSVMKISEIFWEKGNIVKKINIKYVMLIQVINNTFVISLKRDSSPPCYKAAPVERACELLFSWHFPLYTAGCLDEPGEGSRQWGKKTTKKRRNKEKWERGDLIRIGQKRESYSNLLLEFLLWREWTI